MEVSDLIETTTRQAGVKGFARRVRAGGLIPAIVYGPGVEGETPISVDPKVFDLQRQQFGKGHLFQLTIDGGDQLRVQLKDVARDPVKRTYTHLDFYAVDMDQEINIEVQLELTGKPKGAIDGGILSQLQRRIEVVCLPAKVPPKLTADVSDLGVNDNLHLSDIPFPEGVRPASHENETIARVAPPAGPVASAGDSEEGEGAATPEA